MKEIRYGYAHHKIKAETERERRIAFAFNTRVESAITTHLDYESIAKAHERELSMHTDFQVLAGIAVAMFHADMIDDSNLITAGYIYDMINREVERRKHEIDAEPMA